MNIEGKVALITGGASGLGAASARMIANAGGRAVIVDLNEELGAALVGELGEAACFVKADVSEAGEGERAVKTALDKFGALQIALNCAGIGGSQRVIGKEGLVGLDWFAAIIRVNLIGTFNIIRLAAAAMAKNQPSAEGERGVIINTASIAAFDGQIGQAAYSASKGGIVGMTLPIARDLARHGIRVMTIAPGIFDTPLLGKLPDPVRAALCESVPFPPRLGRSEEYAQLARQIIENVMLNGEVIRLDGALRMAPK
jgi:NAD(P)-dependent dehydrogenase (short-subunit alcohol dehydrogenase family)